MCVLKPGATSRGDCSARERVHEARDGWAFSAAAHFGVWSEVAKRERRRERIGARPAGPDPVLGTGHRNRVAVGWSKGRIRRERGADTRSISGQRHVQEGDR